MKVKGAVLVTEVLEMQNIHKSFYKVHVLDDVHFTLRQGEIHALLGENGAGKSTLMNILGGVHAPDRGEIRMNGVSCGYFESPLQSQQKGISFIHQELNLVEDLSVYENLFLGQERIGRTGLLDVDEMCVRSREVFQRMGVPIDPKAPLRSLDASFKQMVEIARALLQDARIIIMDEPTTSLTEYEIQHVMTLMRTLQKQGVSMIFISHKLKEVKDICDRFTVLRDGQVADTGAVSDVTEEALSAMMVGKKVSNRDFFVPRRLGEPVLQVKRFSYFDKVKNINFTLHRGEILGFTGLAGDGRAELFESLFGYRKGYVGDVYVHGKRVRIDHPEKALRAGISFVPKNRKENAVIHDMSAVQNMSLSSLNRFKKRGWLNPRREDKVFEEYKDRLNIKVADGHQSILRLSGGNQQKVILSRWLSAHTDILILDNPTQGVDVGAKNEIYQLISTLAEKGISMILLTSEAPEVLKVCDEVRVMYQGEMTARLSREEADEEMIMSYATGAKREEVLT